MSDRPIAPPEIIDPDFYAEHGYPHVHWERLRREAPAAWCTADGFPPFWAITRYRDVVEISRRPDLFISGPRFVMQPLEAEGGAGSPVRMLLNMDPPEHRDYRKLTSPHFTPRALASKVAAFEQVADDLLDRAAERGPIDFVADVASPLPLVVIAEMLGVPKSERARFLALTNRVVGTLDPEYRQDDEDARAASLRAIGELFTYFQEMVVDRRRTPRDDMTSVLANATLQGQPLPDFELLSYLLMLIAAGNETTRNATTGGFLALLEHPEQLAALRRNPALLRPAIEEMVRWVSPVIHFVRTATQDVDVAGQTIRRGEYLVLFYPSANRDDTVFDAPFEFHVDREPNEHLGFGIGEHFCLGAHLARLELEAIFRALLRRLEDAEIAGPVSRLRGSIVGGIKHLPVRLKLSPCRGAA